MSRYCVNKFGNHEVHKDPNCSHLPTKENSLFIEAYSDKEAIKKARKTYFKDSCGCFYCMNSFNKKEKPHN